MTDIILASKSPRRRGLFSIITDRFTCIEADIDERAFSALAAEAQATRLAERKCKAVAETHPQSVVVGCDTLVALGDDVFGKPRDADEARGMLAALSGNTHHVFTGVAVHAPDFFHTFCGRTAVRFHPMTAREIDEYVASGDPFDKAGSYGIQGMAARYIAGIEGDYYNVMGLPVSALYHLLRERGIV